MEIDVSVAAELVTCKEFSKNCLEEEQKGELEEKFPAKKSVSKSFLNFHDKIAPKKQPPLQLQSNPLNEATLQAATPSLYLSKPQSQQL